MAEFTPITFTRTTEGKTVERVAESAAAAVKFRFEGWTEKATRAAKAAKTTAAKADKTDDLPAGDANAAAAKK